MQDKRETADNQQPTAYQLGKMFYRAGREYNPYHPDTEAFTEFYRGRLDAEEDDELAAEIGSWSSPKNKPSL